MSNVWRPQAPRLVLLLILLLISLIAAPTETTLQADGPLPLSAYPRPKNDNGMGIHWNTNPYGEREEVVDYFVNEIDAMGIKWVKFLNDQTDGRGQDYLVEQLVARDIMPVVRIYTECNKPINLAALAEMVKHYRPMGVYYYEIYNEPDIPGWDGGWCDGIEQDAAYLASIWAPAAREVIAHGGYPSLPSIFPMGKNVPGWEHSFFQQFLQGVKAQGNTDILYRSWGAVHNYAINHPPDYPGDAVNARGQLLTAADIAKYNLDKHHVYAINQARAKQKDPGGYYVGSTPTEDVTGFHQFIAYHDQFTGLFGFQIPLISTEGGATVGSCEDPRYPCVNADMQKAWTLDYYDYMLDEAPDYYFANNTWLIAQKAMDFWGGSVWEDNAWYHDRSGNHLPIVGALKNHSRKGEPRHDQKAVNNWQGPPTTTRPAETTNSSGGILRYTTGIYPPLSKNSSSSSSSTPSIVNTGATNVTLTNSLANYPRPSGDNGRGVHYVPTIMGQPTHMVDHFVSEMRQMNIKWVKIMQGDVPKMEHDYLVEQLLKYNIEPIIRVYKPYNEPYKHLSEFTRTATKMGVSYIELYNEPNLEGFPGGWHSNESISVNRMLDLWIPAADAVKQAGGLPGLPALAAGGNYEDTTFLKAFLDGLIARKRTDLLTGAWLPLHNYFFNHPLDYPQDSVNLNSNPLSSAEIATRKLSDVQVTQINAARAAELQKATFYRGRTIHQDSNAFRKFEAYGKIFFDKFGFYIPIISTEGGAIIGDAQDARYPPVNEADLTNVTLGAYRAMISDVPAYYFTFTPWLLANASGGHWDESWEGAAWYKIDGTVLPVVDALKADTRRHAARPWSAQIAALETPLRQSTVVANSHTSSSSPAGNAPIAVAPNMDKLSAKTITTSGDKGTWELTNVDWRPSKTPYPRMYIDLYHVDGSRSTNTQIYVAWTGGGMLLMPGGTKNHSASMHLRKATDVYIIKVAGAAGSAVQTRGEDGYDLYVTFQEK